MSTYHGTVESHNIHSFELVETLAQPIFQLGDSYPYGPASGSDTGYRKIFLWNGDVYSITQINETLRLEVL